MEQSYWRSWDIVTCMEVSDTQPHPWTFLIYNNIHGRSGDITTSVEVLCMQHP